MALEAPKKARPDLNATLLDQFVSAIPGLVFSAERSRPGHAPADAPAVSGKDRDANQNLALVCSQNIRTLCR